MLEIRSTSSTVTEELVRKKSEHNELIISTLEELSLHQEDIERIEHVQHWCRDLKILLLQGNIIAKIENLHKLKKLEYLNLSMNNIELIENLDQLESLEKLDLTLNFIGNLQSVESLRSNLHLRELTLVGNYCADYKGYRNFVIATLPQLKRLDGEEIRRSDRIVASREYEQIRVGIVQQQMVRKIERDEQKVRWAREKEQTDRDNVGLTDDEVNDRFWKKSSEHCPEIRVEIARQSQKNAQKQNGKEHKVDEKRARRFFADCGRPYNINEAKLEFHFDDRPQEYRVDLQVYR